MNGAPNATNNLFASPDLISWNAIATNDTTSNGLFQIDDAGGGANPIRFYRDKIP